MSYSHPSTLCTRQDSWKSIKARTMSTMKIQEDIFLAKEGDAWYRRNIHGLSPAVREDDDELALIRSERLRPRHVLEVGASNGWRLESIRRYRPRAHYVGIEPSREAVAAGKKKYPKLILKRGVAAHLPFSDSAFDLVLTVFVFHWVSRDKLLKSVAEIDRVLADGGHLIVSDFYSNVPRKNQYRHRKGVFTWKTDYGALFEASGNYMRVKRVVTKYRTGGVSTATGQSSTTRPPEDLLTVMTLYKKKLGIGYIKG